MVELVRHPLKIFEAGREQTYCCPEEGENTTERMKKDLEKCFLNIIWFLKILKESGEISPDSLRNGCVAVKPGTETKDKLLSLSLC